MGPRYLRFVCSELGGNYGLIVRKSVPSPGASRLRSGPGLMQEGAESGLRDSGRLWQVAGLHSGGGGDSSVSRSGKRLGSFGWRFLLFLVP